MSSVDISISKRHIRVLRISQGPLESSESINMFHSTLGLISLDEYGILNNFNLASRTPEQNVTLSVLVYQYIPSGRRYSFDDSELRGRQFMI